jgi:hypothetical protein
MPRFVLDRRTMQMVPEQRRIPSKSEMLAKAKRMHSATIREFSIEDKDLETVIAKIQSGTRNVDYLSLPNIQTNPRIREIFYTLLREVG